MKRTMIVAAALVTLLGASAPAMADRDHDHGGKHGRFNQRSERHGDWRRANEGVWRSHHGDPWWRGQRWRTDYQAPRHDWRFGPGRFYPGRFDRSDRFDRFDRSDRDCDGRRWRR